MSPIVIGVAGIGFLLLLFLIRFPVAFAMTFVGVAGFTYLSAPGPALILLAQDIFGTFSSYPLSVIPMFILMGTFASASGITQRFYKTAYTWVGQLRGGLAIATVLACAGFAAICGSSTASAATMGRIALPEMRKYKYDDALSSGTVAAAGTLGILIPPSTILILYGILTEQSIGKLFIAGVLPGIILTFFFVATVAVVCMGNPNLGPPGTPTIFKDKIRSTLGVIEALILFLFTIGGLFLGWFSPTQAGAVGAGGALLIGLARRQLNWQKFIEAAVDGLQTTCMAFFIVAGAIIFGHFMAISTIPFVLAEWLGGLPIPPMAVMIVIIFIYFVGGFFMDSMGLIMVTIPILYPIVTKFGFDPIWFGVILVLVTEMGVITPPVGINVFVIHGIAPDMALETIFKGAMFFLVALTILIAILIIFPQIVTFLPSLVKL
jgi:C4-dicarboxylate transporter DctM subunit